MKNTALTISTLCVTLIISSCSESKKNTGQDLTQLIELRHKKEDERSSLSKKLSEISKSKSVIKREIYDIEAQSRNEKSNLVRKFRKPIDQSLRKNTLKLMGDKSAEIQLAMKALRKEPNFIEWSSRMDKKAEFKELHLKHTGPVNKKFKKQEEDLISVAKKSVADYEVKVEAEVTEKYADSLNKLRKKFLDLEEEEVKKKSEYSEVSEDFSELVKKIKRVKELTETKQ